MAAKVPDLGSDFAQRLLQDLRRRRERLGFKPSSSGKQQQQRTSNTAAPCDCSNSQKSLGSQKPHQATAHRTHPQGSSATVRSGDARRRDSPNAIAAHAIVPFQGGGGGGGGRKQKPVASNVDLQMALALALSNSGKLQNIELVAHNGSIFFREPGRVQVHNHRNDYLLSPSAHVGGMAIGVQELNDILMAYSSCAGAGEMGRRSSVGAGKKLFRGSMDLEESLSMLMMLQDASDYMEGSGSGKVLLLKGKENRKSATTRSARIVEIVDEDSEAEQQAKNGKITSNASMQIVAHNKYSQGHSPNSRSALQFSDAPSNSMINASKGEHDGSKVRVPNVIARLMGLENLPSEKVVAEHKGTEKFVKSEAVPRKEIRANSMDRKLPIRIVASDKVLSKGLHEDLLALTSYNREESERSAALSNSSLHRTTDSQVRQTMKELLWKMGIPERVGAKIQGDNEMIIHEDRIVTESNLKKSVSVGCRSDAGKKMDFLRRFRRNSGNNKPVIEEKHTTQVKSTPVEKKQATGIKQLLSRDSETKSRRTREKFIKENLATTETNAARKSDKTTQMKRNAQTKHVDRQSVTKKTQNCREMRNETPSQNLEENKSLNPDAARRNPKLANTVVNENHTEVYDFSISKLSGIRNGDGDFLEKIGGAVEDSSTDGAGAGVVSPDQCEQQINELINDPTIAAQERSEDTKALDQSTIAHINSGRTNHTASETTQTLETFTEEQQQQQQQQQQIIVKEQPMDALDPTKISSNPIDSQDPETHVVSCDSFTENQLLLMKMLLKDQYLLETAKTIVGVHVPVSFANAAACDYSDERNELLTDVGREAIRRKCKRTEVMAEVSMVRAANPKLRHLGDLIRELGSDIESLAIPIKPHRQGDDGTAETLRMIFQRDIRNRHPDANSTWDFGWNRVSDLPIEKNQVVRDLEKNILGGIITDVARDLIAVSVSHCSCLCQA